MPLPKGTRVRVKTTSTGKKVRLAFKGGKVIEAKNLKTGKTHTQAEFKADRKKHEKKEKKMEKKEHKGGRSERKEMHKVTKKRK